MRKSGGIPSRGGGALGRGSHTQDPKEPPGFPPSHDPYPPLEGGRGGPPYSLLGLALVLLLAIPAFASPLSPERQKELAYMVRQDCGSCHGLQFKGGLGPAIRPSDLKGKDAKALERIILDGSPGTAMPPWRPLLTEPEAAWIVEQLQKGFPDAR